MLTAMLNCGTRRAAARVLACRIDQWRALSTVVWTRCRLLAGVAEIGLGSAVRDRRISTRAQTCAAGLVLICHVAEAPPPRSPSRCLCRRVGVHYGASLRILRRPARCKQSCVPLRPWSAWCALVPQTFCVAVVLATSPRSEYWSSCGPLMELHMDHFWESCGMIFGSLCVTFWINFCASFGPFFAHLVSPQWT